MLSRRNATVRLTARSHTEPDHLREGSKAADAPASRSYSAIWSAGSGRRVRFDVTQASTDASSATGDTYHLSDCLALEPRKSPCAGKTILNFPWSVPPGSSATLPWLAFVARAWPR